MKVLAIGISVDCQMDLDRSKGYATQYDAKPILWSKMGKMQLEEKKPADANTSFIHAEDALIYLSCHLSLLPVALHEHDSSCFSCSSHAWGGGLGNMKL